MHLGTVLSRSIQGEFNPSFIAGFIVFSFCLPGVFTLQQRLILLAGGDLFSEI